MSFEDWETGTNPFHKTRRHIIVLPLAAVPAPKKLREKKRVGRGFTAAELQAIREIEAERKPIPSFDEMVKATRDGR